MTALKLYELSDQLQILDAQIEARADEIAANGGALPDDLAALLDDAEGAFDEKVERTAMYFKTLKHTAHAVSLERDRLADRVRALDNAAEGVKAYLYRCLTSAGKKDVRGALATVVIQQSPPSVQSSLSSEQLGRLQEAYPDLVKEIPASFALDKAAVKAAHEAKRAIPNGVTVSRGTHVTIK